jgi:hypothetical protein
MADQVFPITFKPGILRDGSPFQGEYCTNGQWTRFFRGFPQNIGGMRAYKFSQDQVTKIPNIKSNAMSVDYTNNDSSNIIIGFSAPYNPYATSDETTYLIQFRAVNDSVVAKIIPPGDNNTRKPCEEPYWQMIPVIFQSGDESKRSMLCVPRNIKSIVSSTGVSKIWNYSNGKFIEVTSMTKATEDYNKLLNEITGGVLFINPYLFIYGNNGLVRWSKSKISLTADKPFQFDLALKHSVNISTDKVIYGAGVRGGTASPSALFWTLSSVVRLTNIGNVNPNDADDISFKKEIITNDSSILSSNCVVEYDGIFYWPGTGRFFTYNGVVVPLENNLNRQTFFENVDMNKRQLVFGVKNTVKDEIWWFYPEKGNADDVGCTRAVIYNIMDNSWYDTAVMRDCGYFDNVTGNMFTVGKNLVPYEGDTDNYIWQHEVGTDQVNNNYPNDNKAKPPVKAIPSYFTTPIISYASFNNFKQPSGIDRWMQIKRIEPNFVFTPAANVTITFNSQEYPLSPVVSSVPLQVTTAQNEPARVEFMFQGRNVSFTFRSEGVGSGYQMSQTFVVADVGDGR